jgi:23S rRNA (uracil1939-C5)-methyltransferase
VESIVRITGLAHGGHGIARIDGQVCFVPYALPGDEITVRITRRSKGVLWGAIDRIVSPSPDRIDPGCSVYGRCGACTWLHFAYPAQAEWKARIVRDCIERIAGVATDVAWADDPDRRLHYRTRAEFHGDGTVFGFYTGGSHDVVDVDTCPLCHPRLNAALATLRELRVRGSVEITINPEGKDVLVWTKKQIRGVADRFDYVQWPGAPGERASFVFDGIPIVNGAFSQSSLLLNRELLRVVREAVGDSERVLDLYCGNGNLSLRLDGSRRIVGLDHNRAAVDAARALDRGDYRVGNEHDFIAAIDAEPWEVILLDPPRTGAKAIAPELAHCKARRIVYVSCDPATLARDLKILAGAGWHVTSVTAVDLFPNTFHIETVCTLERRAR